MATGKIREANWKFGILEIAIAYRQPIVTGELDYYYLLCGV